MTDKKSDGTDSQTINKIQEDEVSITGQDSHDEGPEATVFPPLRSEDSGLGLSASPSEQQLPPGHDSSSPALGICTKAENVWRKEGSMENMSKCLQDVLAFVITRCTNTPC